MHRNKIHLIVMFVMALSIMSGGCRKHSEVRGESEDKARTESALEVEVAATYRAVDYRKDGGEWKKLDKGARLGADTEIRTGEDGLVSLKYSDGAIVRANSKSEFKLKKSKFETLDIDLNKGELFARIQKFKEPEKVFTITTPSATVGVRGTEYDVRHTDNITMVFVLKGKVEVKNSLGSRTLDAGRSVEVKLGKAPEQPSTFSPDRFEGELNIWMAPLMGQEQSSASKTIRNVDFRNFDFGDGVVLKNGKLEKPEEDRTRYYNLESLYYANLMNNGREQALVTIYDEGTLGNHDYNWTIRVYDYDAGNPVMVHQFDDSSFGYFAPRIAGGLVFLPSQIFMQNDATCCASYYKISRFKWKDGKFVKNGQFQITANEYDKLDVGKFVSAYGNNYVYASYFIYPPEIKAIWSTSLIGVQGCFSGIQANDNDFNSYGVEVGTVDLNGDGDDEWLFNTPCGEGADYLIFTKRGGSYQLIGDLFGGLTNYGPSSTNGYLDIFSEQYNQEGTAPLKLKNVFDGNQYVQK